MKVKTDLRSGAGSCNRECLQRCAAGYSACVRSGRPEGECFRALQQCQRPCCNR